MELLGVIVQTVLSWQRSVITDEELGAPHLVGKSGKVEQISMDIRP